MVVPEEVREIEDLPASTGKLTGQSGGPDGVLFVNYRNPDTVVLSGEQELASRLTDYLKYLQSVMTQVQNNLPKLPAPDKPTEEEINPSV